MIEVVVTNLAARMGMKLSKTTLEDGSLAGCHDAFLLRISKRRHRVNMLIYRNEIDDLNNGIYNAALFLRIKSALSRLELLLSSS